MANASYSIGTSNESSLHLSLKKWYSLPGDRFEQDIEGYIIDIVRGSHLIEIQTKNLAAVKKKVQFLSEKYTLTLVYPIREEKQIVRVSLTDENELSRRKSPKKGSVFDLFDELVRYPEVLSSPNVRLELVFVVEEEVRVGDGKGSWRRHGESIKDRRLLEVTKTQAFLTNEDFLVFLPGELPEAFSNKELGQQLGINPNKARKITYSLRRMGIISLAGKKGNALLYSKLKQYST